MLPKEPLMKRSFSTSEREMDTSRSVVSEDTTICKQEGSGVSSGDSKVEAGNNETAAVLEAALSLTNSVVDGPASSWIMSEPTRKKRAAFESTQIPEAVVVVPGGDSVSEETGSEECLAHTPIIEKEVDVSELPDPSFEVSPDEYLQQLVKAMYGLDLEVKKSLSLESFFTQVTEEQIAAYSNEVVGAVRNNNLEALKQLHAEGQPLNCFNRFGESLLNMACRRGFEDIVQYLLETENLDVRISDDGGRTPLHDACWNPSPQLKICEWIIARDPSLLFIADRRGCTAFQYARPQHWEIWRNFLLENRAFLAKLTQPDVRSRLVKS